MISLGERKSHLSGSCRVSEEHRVYRHGQTVCMGGKATFLFFVEFPRRATTSTKSQASFIQIRPVTVRNGSSRTAIPGGLTGASEAALKTLAAL